MHEPNVDNHRRHDLDAVRSTAMQLGIFLHAALAYTGGWWWISEGPGSGLLGVTISGIHGFRMQLFFLLSGFFTAMLWRKRGLKGLFQHRTKRIVFPLLLGSATIVPALSITSQWAVSVQSAAVSHAGVDVDALDPAPSDDIWTVAAYGDMNGLRAFGSDSDLLNTPDPTFGITPLGWTALKNQPEAAAYLIAAGADPSARYKDQNTPLHTACFFGRFEIAELLLSAGADLSAQSATGEFPLDALKHDQKTTEFIANLIQVPIDFDQVADGRVRIGQLTEQGASTPVNQADSSGALAEALHINFFHHLWFLWFLCLLIAGFGVVVSIARYLPRFTIPGRLVSLPLCLVWLVPITMAPQWFMQGIGPDTSTGIIPALHVVLYYAIFFGFGALVFAVRGARERFGPPRSWSYILPTAISLFFLVLTFEQSERAAAFIGNETVLRLLSDFIQVIYAWLMIFGFIALFESLLHRERGWVRYLSDSSYWLYLIHLPLIIVGQTLLLQADLGPLMKTTVLTIVVTLGLLVSYQIGVRYTPIGTLLNGRRVRPSTVRVES